MSKRPFIPPRRPGWVDLISVPHWSRPVEIMGNREFRRFCSACRNLRRCYEWQGAVFCKNCCKKADGEPLVDAGYSALARTDEHRRTTPLRHSRERNYPPRITQAEPAQALTPRFW